MLPLRGWLEIHVRMFSTVGYKTQVQGRGQGYENLGIVSLEMALKAMRFDETTRKRV